jgi:hypothetical protein
LQPHLPERFLLLQRLRRFLDRRWYHWTCA